VLLYLRRDIQPFKGAFGDALVNLPAFHYDNPNELLYKVIN
jgi:hypothetical protein